ncbi:MAG: ATP-binding cassette domain-containing protein, partial [Muribaculaceae bacterium]|nr:ATP-binding cassette domain-containing protein [Muribaculaceae bacterium]
PQPTPGEPHPSDSLNDADPLISMRHCRVAYGSSTIISDISWDILPGERWMLSGRNGSGKSTLLSLICADNPQRYVNDITAFGHHRRSGESIWDIKRHIGYISPEMHLHFHGSGDVATIVAQGLNDTVGLFVRVRPDQMALALEWLKLFGMEHLASRRFDTLSAGEQRLALLARTLIKQPRLLILDEPLHGLDLGRRRAVRDLVSALMERHPRSALIFVTHYPATELPDCINHSLSLS